MDMVRRAYFMAKKEAPAGASAQVLEIYMIKSMGHWIGGLWLSTHLCLKRGLNMANDNIAVSIAATDAEECLLGAILIESCRGTKEAIQKASMILNPLDFKGVYPGDSPQRWARNARIFLAMSKCELPPHVINTALQLVKLNLFDIHDADYMRHCEYLVPCSLDYMDYAQAVKYYSTQRQAKYYVEKGDIKNLNRITNQNKPLGPVPL